MTDEVDQTAPPSDRARVRRGPHLGVYDRAVIDAILDAGLVAHVGVVGDGGQPFVIPCAYARIGDEVVIHGSAASRLIRTGANAAPLCVTVTLLDGMIVARSLFESSMRYRSVVVLGEGRAVDDPVEKRAALAALSDRLIPGRGAEVRDSTDKEVAATRLVALSLDESSAKVSDGFSEDPDDDIATDVWAGVVPLTTAWGTPFDAPNLRAGIPVPPSIAALTDTPLAPPPP